MEGRSGGRDLLTLPSKRGLADATLARIIARFSARKTRNLPNPPAWNLSYSPESCRNLRFSEGGGDPYGTRTRVFAVRGRRPGPLDEGA